MIHADNILNFGTENTLVITDRINDDAIPKVQINENYLEGAYSVARTIKDLWENGEGISVPANGLSRIRAKCVIICHFCANGSLYNRSYASQNEHLPIVTIPSDDGITILKIARR